MRFRIDHHSGVPAYRQLMDQIKLQVSTGRLNPGDELPSTRTLSTEIGLNHMTISKAYSLLEREGLLERQRGKPLTIAATTNEQRSVSREDALREALASPASLARQLGIATADAVKLFKELLEKQS